MDYQFYSPDWLWLLLLIPVILFLRFIQFKKEKTGIKFSRPASDLESLSFKPIGSLIFGIYTFIGIGFILLVMAMAKPYLPYSDDREREYGEGIDIIISMDVSGSMMATDFSPNRLAAAKEMAKEFIDGRASDKIGFVAFEGEAYTACPTTRNYDYLKQTIDEIQSGMLEPGTAIGTGLGTAVAQLRNDTIVSKVIILLTDGENNRGEITPMAAAQLAQKKNITVYTIGVGKKGYVDMPVNTPFGVITQKTQVNIDEGLLDKMAKLTGGKYFRATDENSLRAIYHKIDQMETRKMVDDNIKREPPYNPERFLKFGLILLFLGFGIEQIVLKKNA